MKIISDRKHLAHLIKMNIRWYDWQAKQRDQGTLSKTWVKYVAKLNLKQWTALQHGSDALSLSTYQHTLRLLTDMEESVLGTAYQSCRQQGSKPKLNSMATAKQNMQKVLAGIKQQQKSRPNPKAKSNSAMNKAKQNLLKVLGPVEQTPSRSKRVITLIKAQRRKNRFNVYVNGRYAFPAGINELTKYHLRIGMSISRSLEKKISESSDVSKMFTRASARIVHHLRTEHEIQKWLHQKYDASPTDADKVIKMLKNYHLIDDSQYSKEYIREEIISGSKGPLAISRFLRSKGVSDLTIQDVMAKVYPVDKQLSVAKHMAKDKFKMQTHTPFAKRLRKIKTALVRKGFNFEIASQAVNECHFQPDHSMQKLLLNKYTRQAFRRYGRKLTPNNRYQINMKIKRFLYRKGFDFDTIDQAMEEYQQNK